MSLRGNYRGIENDGIYLHNGGKKRRENMSYVESKCGYYISNIPFTTSRIHQCQAVMRAPPFLPTFCQIMCSEYSVLLGLADYSRGKKRQNRQGGRERNMKRERERSRVGGGYSSESSEARQIQWRNPPSSQMNIAAFLLLLLLPSPSLLFSPPPFLAPSL